MTTATVSSSLRADARPITAAITIPRRLPSTLVPIAQRSNAIVVAGVADDTNIRSL